MTDTKIIEKKLWYNVEAQLREGDVKNFGLYTRIEQFETYEEAKNYIKSILNYSEALGHIGYSIFTSIYEYDELKNPYELDNTITWIEYYKGVTNEN